MSQVLFKAIPVAEKVFWVGAVDWNLRDFHGYNTERGTTYNAFLILDEKVTLVDTVKGPFFTEMMTRIASVIPPEKIDYVVSNHAEMDHSGCLPRLIAAAQPEKVLASPKGVEALHAHFHGLGPLTAVGDGESLALGESTLHFLETRMLHWPDSMFSYLDRGGVLFSQDGFGMHLASAERFADEIDLSLLEYEARKYFANILTPYAGLVQRQLQAIKARDIPIKLIAPDHGPLYRRDLHWILDQYAGYAAQAPTNKAVIVYDSMWGSTESMARAIAEGVTRSGAKAKCYEMKTSHRSTVATALLDAGAFIAGAPTMNNNLFPPMADLLTYVKGLRFKNLIGAAFGSYGWSGESIKQINEVLDAMKVNRIGEGVRSAYVPDDGVIEACVELGLDIGGRLLAFREAG